MVEGEPRLFKGQRGHIGRKGGAVPACRGPVWYAGYGVTKLQRDTWGPCRLCWQAPTIFTHFLAGEAGVRPFTAFSAVTDHYLSCTVNSALSGASLAPAMPPGMTSPPPNPLETPLIPPFHPYGEQASTLKGPRVTYAGLTLP